MKIPSPQKVALATAACLAVLSLLLACVLAPTDLASRLESSDLAMPIVVFNVLSAVHVTSIVVTAGLILRLMHCRVPGRSEGVSRSKLMQVLEDVALMAAAVLWVWMFFDFWLSEVGTVAF